MILKSFSLPAFIGDFPLGSAEYIDLSNWWNINVGGWIEQAMPSEPSFFYNPIGIDIPSTAASAKIDWVAFSGRIDQFYSANPPVNPIGPYKLTQEQIYSLADTGYYNSQNKTFQDVPSQLCPQADWNSSPRTFGPFGPRGWMDEYCEWTTVRDRSDNLVRIDFACENPEYWNTLWKVSPDKVRELYESTLNHGAPAANQISVTLADLQLTDSSGNPVIDPDTGGPAYNPLNKWNSGPIAVRNGAGSYGGVMHLTSTPNTLQTELGLAGAATPQYQPPSGTGNSDPQLLICCGKYGREYRHSAPHIGQLVNQVVGGQLTGKPNLACLADPVGLYIQLPGNPKNFQFAPNIKVGVDVPQDAKASDIFQVVRGFPSVIDPVTNQPFPGNFVLHAVCQIPAAWLAMNSALTLNDIVVNHQPLTWGGQVANQFKIALYARPLSAPNKPPTVPCASGESTPGQPKQCLWAALWDAMIAINEPSPTGAKMPLASNSTFIAPWLPSDGSTQQLVLTCNPGGTDPLTVHVLDPAGDGPDPSIEVTTTGTSPAYYAVPGDTYPDNYTAISISVTVPAGASAGLRGIQITQPGDITNVLWAAVYIKEAC